MFLVRQLDDFRSDDGQISQEKISGLISEILAERSGWGVTKTYPDMAQGNKGDPISKATGTSWGAILTAR